MINRVDATRALRDVVRNQGAMWEPQSGIGAKMLWDDLKRRGWVDWNLRARRWQPSVAGRAVIREDRQDT